MVINKIIKQGNSIVVPLPRRYMDALQWKLGDYVVLSLMPDKIIIEKVRFPQDEAKGDQHRPD